MSKTFLGKSRMERGLVDQVCATKDYIEIFRVGRKCRKYSFPRPSLLHWLVCVLEARDYKFTAMVGQCGWIALEKEYLEIE